MRYDFHKELAKTKKNPKYILPEDINKPVIDRMNEIGCEPVADEIKDFQNHLRYGSIRAIHDDRPTAALIVQVDSGMADGYKESEIKRIGKWTITTTFNVRNKNIDKKKKANNGPTKNNSANNGNKTTA